MTPNFFSYFRIQLLVSFYHADRMCFFLVHTFTSTQPVVFTLYTKKYNPCVLLFVVVISSVTVFSVASREMKVKGKMWNWSSPLTERAAADIYELSRKRGSSMKTLQKTIPPRRTGTHTHNNVTKKRHTDHMETSEVSIAIAPCVCECVCVYLRVRVCACVRCKRAFLCWCFVASLSHHLSALAP